jgi:hypothetical protein
MVHQPSPSQLKGGKISLRRLRRTLAWFIYGRFVYDERGATYEPIDGHGLCVRAIETMTDRLQRPRLPPPPHPPAGGYEWLGR